MIKHIFFLLLIGFFAFDSTAQNGGVEIDGSQNFILIKGKKYYIHIVKKGESLYSISKKYKVSQKEIALANSGVLLGLRSGQKLKIPYIEGQTNVPNVRKKHQKFFYHRVKKRQTTYFLSRKYNISVAEIIKYNPDIKNGLKVGEELKIPKVIVDKENGIYNNGERQFALHKVKKISTLTEISSEFHVDYDYLKKFNTNLKENLLIGQVVRIPKEARDDDSLLVKRDTTKITKPFVLDPFYFADSISNPCESFKYELKSEPFKVAVLLPLFLEENSSINFNIKTKKIPLKRSSVKFLEIYEGMVMAVEKLRQEGFSVDIHVYDTENSKAKIKQIIGNEEFKKMDLIIGPVYTANLKPVANFAQRHEINLVLPLSQNNDIVKFNPYVFQVLPTQAIRIKQISNYLAQSYDKSIVVIHNGTAAEKKLIDVYRNELSRSFSDNDTIDKIVFKVINYKDLESDGISDALSVGLENFVIVPSTEEVFVTKIINELYSFSADYEIALFGMKKWERFKTLDLELLHHLQMHYPSANFIDYESNQIKNFVKKYQKIYKTDPSYYSFLGYDISYYFLNALKRYGKNFQSCLSPYDFVPNKSGLQFEFDFRRTNKLGGFINHSVFVLKRTKDLHIKKLDVNKVHDVYLEHRWNW